MNFNASNNVIKMKLLRICFHRGRETRARAGILDHSLGHWILWLTHEKQKVRKVSYWSPRQSQSPLVSSAAHFKQLSLVSQQQPRGFSSDSEVEFQQLQYFDFGVL